MAGGGIPAVPEESTEVPHGQSDTPTRARVANHRTHHATPPRHRPLARRGAGGRGQRLAASERAAAQDAFLAAFLETWTVGSACQAVGISRQTLYRWRREDASFRERYEFTELDVRDLILEEVWRRGVTGWEEPMLWHGRPVLDVEGQPVMRRRYSSRLLLLLARLMLPEFQRPARRR